MFSHIDISQIGGSPRGIRQNFGPLGKCDGVLLNIVGDNFVEEYAMYEDFFRIVLFFVYEEKLFGC